MGLFLSLSGVIGKTQSEVAESLRNYARSQSGGLENGNVDDHQDNRCLIKETNGNTTIFYPNYFMEWDQSSAFLSLELKVPVFSFHIHDGDLWMYFLYMSGVAVDQFNPIPDYWGDVTAKEAESFKGNADLVAKYIPGLNPENIRGYLIRWNLEQESKKSYPEDEFFNEDWQLVDFMKKIGLSFPSDGDGNPTGEMYRLWTGKLILKS
jgi:hypothetical protein